MQKFHSWVSVAVNQKRAFDTQHNYRAVTKGKTGSYFRQGTILRQEGRCHPGAGFAELRGGVCPILVAQPRGSKTRA